MALDEISYDLINSKSLERGSADMYLQRFSSVLNDSWGESFGGMPEKLRERFQSGEIFVAAYSRGRPAGILETISLKLDEPNGNIPSALLEEVSKNLGKPIDELTENERGASYICSQLSDYAHLTNSGKWRTPPNNPNTLLFVDLTVPEIHRGGRYFPPISTGLVNIPKFLLSRDENAEVKLGYLPKKRLNDLKKTKETLPQLKSLRWAVTFTPDHNPIRGFHLKQYAFDVGIIIENARPGHKGNGGLDLSRVRPTCYMAPEFVAPLGYSKG